MDFSTVSPEKLVLACARTGDTAAWEEFVRRFHRLIATVVLRVARRWGDASQQVIDELVQETYLKLCAENCRLLRSFRAHHADAFYGYLKVITANLVHDHLKALHSQKRGGDVVMESEDAPEPAGQATIATDDGVRTTENRILMQEIDACLCGLGLGPHSKRDRRIFWLYYRAGLTANAIAALPSIGLGRKGVESTILRLTRSVRERLVQERQVGTESGIRREGIRPSESLS